MKKVGILWGLLALAVALSGCFSDWKDDQARITLVLGNAAASGRAITESHEHTIEFSNVSESLTLGAKGPTVKAVVPSGTWTITVNTFENGNLYATGSVTENLRARQNNTITVLMKVVKEKELVFYEVTFETGGGEPVPDTQTVPEGGKVIQPSQPELDGSFFDGWYYGDVLWDFDDPVTEDMTLTVKWDVLLATERVVYFYSNGDILFSEKVELNTAVGRPANPTLTGYTFVDWYTEADLINLYNFAAPVTENTNLYAKWTPITYTVEFDKNNTDSDSTEADPAVISVIFPATTVSPLPNQPTRTGFEFNGWSTAKEGPGVAFTHETPVTGNITVYARWQEITPESLEVTFDKNTTDNGSTDASPIRKVVTPPETTVDSLPTEPTRPGYTFTSWNTAADGSGASFTAVTEVTDDIMVYAQWSAITYTVTFNKNNTDSGSTEANPASIPVTFPATTVGSLPAEPTRPDYTFAGWRTATGASFTAATVVTDDIMVLAQWNRLTYSITFINDGVELPNLVLDVPTGEAVTLPSGDGLIKAGYIYYGWNTNADGTGTRYPAGSSYTPTESGTLYVMWKLPIGLTVVISPSDITLSPIDAEAEADPVAFAVITVTGFDEDTGEVEYDIAELSSALSSAGYSDLNFSRGRSYDTDTQTLTVTVLVKPDEDLFFNPFTDPIITIEDYLTSSEAYPLVIPPVNQPVAISSADGISSTDPMPVRQSNIKAFNTYANTNGFGKHYELIEDVTLEGENNWVTIGGTAATIPNPFTGTFNGNNKTISGLKINSTATNLGMFRGIGAGGVVENLTLANIDIRGNAITGTKSGVAVSNSGTVQNCSVTGTITRGHIGGVVGQNTSTGIVKNCYSSVNADGNTYSGGVVGSNNSGIVEYCYSSGNITGYGNLGGVVGENRGTVRYCYATGDVNVGSYGGGTNSGGVVGHNDTNGVVSNCYATGTVGDTVFNNGKGGGVVGLNSSTVEYCYATGDVVGTTSAGGVVGENDQYSSQTVIRYCVALNAAVTRSKTDVENTGIGRVAGTVATTLTNNRGRTDMVMTENGSTVATGTANATNKQGQSVATGTGTGQYNNQAFWTGLTFNLTTIWEWDATRQLPTLRNVGPQ